MKNEKGEITIPAILITIILIVLGGICIFMLTGENGLFVPKRYEQNVENNNTVINSNETQNDNTLTVPVK